MTKQNNLFLIGPMGAGKSTIGRYLSKLTGMDIYDSDEEIEKLTGATVAWIFELEQEAGFRRREHLMVAELTQKQHIVLSTGGGSIIDPRNRQALADNGTVIYLQVSLKEQLKRTGRKPGVRPMIAGQNAKEKLIRLNAEREPLYQSTADLVYETESFTPYQLAKKIIRDWRKMQPSSQPF